MVIFCHFHTIIFRATCGDIRWIKDPKNAAVRCIILSLLSALTWNWPILRHFGTVSNSGIFLKDFQESSQNCSIFTNFSQHTLQTLVHNVRKFQASSFLGSKMLRISRADPEHLVPKTDFPCCLPFNTYCLWTLIDQRVLVESSYKAYHWKAKWLFFHWVPLFSL